MNSSALLAHPGEEDTAIHAAGEEDTAIQLPRALVVWPWLAWACLAGQAA